MSELDPRLIFLEEISKWLSDSCHCKGSIAANIDIIEQGLARRGYMRSYVQRLQDEIDKLRGVLVEIEQRCDSIESDAKEADKVWCHAEWIRFEISRVYPKCERPGFKEDDTPPESCSVPECWHYVRVFPGKWTCSSDANGRTGAPGCPGMRERTVGTA